LKCNLAEKASAGFQFNCFDILMTKHLITGIWTTYQVCLLKFTEKSLSIIKQKL
jgi:hypothetical protein